MGALAPVGAWVTRVLQHLPRSVRHLLDAWSHRVAQRKQRQRRDGWLRRKQAPAEQPPVNYRLKHWRD